MASNNDPAQGLHTLKSGPGPAPRHPFTVISSTFGARRRIGRDQYDAPGALAYARPGNGVNRCTVKQCSQHTDGTELN